MGTKIAAIKGTRQTAGDEFDSAGVRLQVPYENKGGTWARTITPHTPNPIVDRDNNETLETNIRGHS